MKNKSLRMTALSVAIGLVSGGAWAADGKLVVRFKEVAHPFVELSYAQRAGQLGGNGGLKARFPLRAGRASSTSRGVDRSQAYRHFRLDRYFEMPVPQGAGRAQIDNLLSTLKGNPDIEIAYYEPEPLPADAGAEPAVTVPDFSGQQGYLYDRDGNSNDNFALGGVDAHYAWTLPGGDGSGVDVVSSEIGAFNNSHVDLPQPFMVVGDYVIDGHDTASAGIIASLDNGFGTTGIAHGARLGYAKYGVDRMVQAAEQLSPGSVMQVGIHYRHDSLDQYLGCGSSCYMPLDYYDGPYDAVRYITQELGVHVVAAAGNGNINLDHSYFNGRFDPAQRDSGSFLVGAADPATGLRASFSNYGARVNVFSWGWNVTTTGYGGLYSEPNAEYTATFSGTSSANPIVAGTVASLQGIARAAGLGALGTADMRDLMVLTGYPMQNGNDTTIGSHPDLRVAAELLLGGGGGGGCALEDPNVGNYPAWNSGTVYTEGEQVSYNQLVWQANYWTQGNEPTATAPQWQLVSDVETPWSADATYNGGDEANHEGRRYRAQWWTRGDEPGAAGVWLDIGSSSCS